MNCPFKVGDIIRGKLTKAVYVVVKVDEPYSSVRPYNFKNEIKLTKYKNFTKLTKLTKLERALL